MSVARCLAEDRRALVEADIGPTVLYQLARGPRTIVEIVIAAYMNGDRLPVSAVRRLVDDALGIKPKAMPDVLDQGGLSGMRRAAAKLKADAAELAGLARAILSILDEAMKPMAEGKRVNKGALASQVVSRSRDAHRLVRSIAAPFDRSDSAKHAGSTGWGRAQIYLEQLASEPRWPTKADFEPWLVHSIVPTLHFIVHGEPKSEAAVEVPATSDDILIEPHDLTSSTAAAVSEGQTHIVAPSMEPDLDAEERAAAIYETRAFGDPVHDDVLSAAEFVKEPRIELNAPPLATAPLRRGRFAFGSRPFASGPRATEERLGRGSQPTATVKRDRARVSR